MQTFLKDLGLEWIGLWQRLGFGSGSRAGWMRAALIHLLVLGAFGIFLPFGQGIGFFDAVVLGAYQALAVVFAAPVAAAGFEKQPGFGRAVARIVACLVYGGLMSWGMILLGTATVLLTHTIYVGPSLELLGETGLFGIGLSAAVTTAALWLTLRISPGTAKLLIRVVFFGLLILFFFRSRWLPDIALTGTGISLVAEVVLLGLLYRDLRAAGPDGAEPGA